MIKMSGRLLPLKSAVVVAALSVLYAHDCVAAGPNPASANQRMYEKYKSEQQKFLDDFDGASTQLETHELLPVVFSTIRKLSRYEPPPEYPELIYLSTQELNRLACKDTCSVLGHYAGGRQIYLDDRLKPLKNLFDRSVLLHEVVHYLQGLEGSHYVDPADTGDDAQKCRLWYQREREAYAIQEAYLIMVSSPVRAGYFPARAPC
jgi:hypothetical protein